MKKTWILVADNSHARIFTTANHTSPLEELETLAHPESRLHEQKMTSDLPGSAGGNGMGSRHAYQSESDPKEFEAEQFARDISVHLQAALDKGNYEQLLLVASPGFLGELRNKLPGRIKDRVCLELNKNITVQSPEEIRAHLPEYLPTG